MKSLKSFYLAWAEAHACTLKRAPHTLKACATIIAMVLVLAGCKDSGAQEKKVEARSEPRNPLEITVGPELLKEVRIGEPVWATVATKLEAAGRVEADETRLARISSPVTGRITELDVVEGQVVKRGQLLATIYSTELSDAQFSFLRAYSQQQLAQRSVTRAKQLLNADVIGSAELQRREAELLEASAELSSSRDQLRVLGLTEEAIAKLETARTINSVTPIVATINGTVTERKVTIGQIVQPADTLLILADLSHVWLVADIPEQNAGTITVGQAVEADIPALPGITIHGKLSFVSSIVNPETRTVRTRMDLPNAGGRYKPAMLAMMTLKDNEQRKRVVPASAVVRENNADCIFVQTGADRFTMRQVTLGEEFEGNRVLTGGVVPGEKIVVDGAFHLNNERKRRAVQGD